MKAIPLLLVKLRRSFLLYAHCFYISTISSGSCLAVSVRTSLCPFLWCFLQLPRRISLSSGHLLWHAMRLLATSCLLAIYLTQSEYRSDLGKKRLCIWTQQIASKHASGFSLIGKRPSLLSWKQHGFARYTCSRYLVLTFC